MLDGTVSAGEMSPGKMGERAITHRLAVHLECELTKLRRIPHHKVGHFVYFDPTEVALHIRTKLKIPARG
ncbi:MAG: hypothetical protein ACREFX_07500 [Opitutaceae bacterium]